MHAHSLVMHALTRKPEACTEFGHSHIFEHCVATMCEHCMAVAWGHNSSLD